MTMTQGMTDAQILHAAADVLARLTPPNKASGILYADARSVLLLAEADARLADIQAYGWAGKDA